MPDAERGESAPMFRRVFEVPFSAKSAKLLICGLGYNEVFINGRRVGDGLLDPAQTDYNARAFYLEHDVAGFLRKGANAIGVMLGDGWFNQNRVWKTWYEGKGMSYGCPRFIARMEIVSDEGKKMYLDSDLKWKCSIGPITENNVYAGERYDARLEKPGWDTAGYDDSKWILPVEATEPCARFEMQEIAPMKRIGEIVPKSVVEVKPGVWVADMSQNFSGWLRIRVSGPAGAEIKLRFAETIFPDGMIDTASTGVFATLVEQIDTYICRGSGEEVWEPRFTYHGFRYVEITGWPGKLTANDITGIIVHTALERAGSFESSDERLNILHRMALWTHRSNVHGIPEDCPVRERCGWLGDANVVCEFSIWNFKSADFWGKYLDDIETTRQSNGGIPFNIAPGKRTSSTAKHDWMAAFILIPWYIYVYHGRREVLERHYDGMEQVIERFEEKMDGWILAGGFGDWFEPGERANPTQTHESLTTTIWFYRCAQVMSKVSGILVKRDEERKFGEWARKIREAFIRKFFNSETRSFGSQTSNAMALHFGLVPDGEHANVLSALVKDLRETRKMHYHVGIFGLRFLFEVLARNGHAELAVELLHQDTYPSFGDLIGRGATTLWEYWGEPEVDKAHGPRSLSHPMMGGYDNWFYNSLAGIRPDEDNPGFEHFFMEPNPVPSVKWARAEYESPCGRIVSEWKYEGKILTWTVEIPKGTEATAKIPFSGGGGILKSGKYLFVDGELIRS